MEYNRRRDYTGTDVQASVCGFFVLHRKVDDVLSAKTLSSISHFILCLGLQSPTTTEENKGHLGTLVLSHMPFDQLKCIVEIFLPSGEIAITCIH